MGEQFCAYLDEDPAVAFLVADVEIISILPVEVGQTLFLFVLFLSMTVFDQDLKCLFLKAFLLENVLLPDFEITHKHYEVLLLRL